MGRQAKAWWNESKKAWYVELSGRQIRLATGKDAKQDALRELRRILAVRDSGQGVRSALLTQDVFALFLREVAASVERGERAQVTYDGYERWLASAETEIGNLSADVIRPKHVTAWLATKPGWNTTSRFNGITAVKAAFRWAKRVGHLETNPLADMAKPTPNRRTTQIVGTDVARIIAESRGTPFHEFVRALYGTGCRPGELIRLTASMIDLQAGVWRIPNKTAHTTGRTLRTVYLSADMVGLSRELAARHPEGPVFRNRLGNAWTRSSLAIRFRKLRAAGVLKTGEVPYSARHGYVTDALERGIPIAEVAELVGHKDTTMISRVYGHLDSRSAHMIEAAKRVRPATSFELPVQESDPSPTDQAPETPDAQSHPDHSLPPADSS